MKTTIAPRIAALALAAAVPLASVMFAPSAQAVTTTASSAAGWLSDQLTNGVVHNAQYDFDDYGLSLDVFFALDSLQTRQSTADSIIDALAKSPSSYIGSGASIYAGSVGKLAAAVQLDGRDATHFGGVNLISTAEDRVVTSGAEKGRASDSFDPSDPYGGDYSNSIGQAWVVRALSTAHSSLAADATSYLLKQQCSDGSFRVTMGTTACATGTVDGTAFAVQALLVAKAQGATDVSDDVAGAVSWLDGAQASDGSFSDDGAANTNSTALGASTLAQAGETSRAQKAAAWIVGRQATTKNSVGTKLSSEVGAVAFDSAAFTAGKADGITVGTRDQWTRATAQAAIGLNIALPAGSGSSGSGSGSGGSSSGGSSSGSTGSGSGGTFFSPGSTSPTADPTPTPTPTPTETPTDSSPSTDAPVSAAPAASKTSSDDGNGISAGWIVAAVAGFLIIGTAGAAGIGRLRGGRTP